MRTGIVGLLTAAALAASVLMGCHTAAPAGTGPAPQAALAADGAQVPPLEAAKDQPINWLAGKDGKPVKQGYVNWEAEKQQTRMNDGSKGIPTDTIVIHHSDGTYADKWQELSRVQLNGNGMYRWRYENDGPDFDPHVKGLTPHSGHYRTVDGKQAEVFYAYHWLIHKDGTVERLLKDNEVGWHANKWSVNLRSVAICFDGDYSSSPPSPMQMQACARLMASYRRKFPIKYVVGHKDVSSTQCPGSWWPEGRAALIKLTDEEMKKGHDFIREFEKGAKTQ
jgi:hypothetical protein